MSNTPHSPEGPIRVGHVEVDLTSGELRRAGLCTILPEQPLRILRLLLQRPGDLVTRDALRGELWSDDTFVDFEHGLNSAIKRLRDLLGDSAESPQYVETVPRRGYRLVAPVESSPAASASMESRETQPRGRSPRQRRRRLALAFVAAASLGAVAWQAAAWVQSHSAVGPASSNIVAVAVFANRTGDETLSELGRLASHRVIGAIGRVEAAAVLPETIPVGWQAPGSRGTRRERGRNAALVVEGAYYLRGDRLEFQPNVVDGLTGKLLYSAPPVSGARHQPDDALVHVAQLVAGAVAVHFDNAFGGLSLTSAPPVLDAYLEYQAGRELFERDYDRLLAHLQRAERLSPDFLLPRLTLAMAYDNLGDAERTHAQMASITANAARLTTAERLLVEYLSQSLARRPAEALRTLLDLETLAPDSWIVNYGIQMESLVANRPDVGIAAFDRLALDDRNLRFNGWRLNALARALHDTGFHRRELQAVRQARAYEPTNVVSAAGEVRALAALGRVREVDRIVNDSLAMAASPAGADVVMEQAARELLAHGHSQAARAVAGRAADWLRARPHAEAVRPQARLRLGRLLYLAERPAESILELERLVGESDALLEAVGNLGAISARLGRRERALEMSERLRTWPVREVFGQQMFWRACIAAELGDDATAVDLLRDALAQGHYFGLPIHQNPHFAPLRDFFPFLELSRPQK